MREKTFISNLTHKGFSVIEIVVASASLIILATGLTSAYLFFQKSYLTSGTDNRALLVAEETLEVVRSIAAEDYNRVLQGKYGLLINDQGNWTFSGTEDIVGPFTRSVVLSPFEDDSDIKVAVAEVSWRKSDNTTTTVRLTSYLTNWQKAFDAGGCAVINTSTACLDPGAQYKKIKNILLRNSCNFDINTIGATLAWDTTSTLKNITASTTSAWDEACTYNCDPIGPQNSGVTVAFGDNKFTLAARSSVNIDEILWSGNMYGSTLVSFKPIFDDGSSAEISNYQLPICGTFVDFVEPGAITDLAVSLTTATTSILTWTAPGDDGSVGTALNYDIRYSTAPIDEFNWTSANQVTGEPFPQVSGTTQNMEITGLNSETLYYFAIKTLDETPNTSALSNVVSTTTIDNTLPAAVSNLQVSTTTLTTATLTWTAPGEDGNVGTATSYDLRYSTSLISDANWSLATQVTGEPTPQISGSAETMSVSSLTASTTYYFAIKTSDSVPNISNLSNIASSSTLPIPDTTAPSAIVNLAITSTTLNSIFLSWTAPGDDSNVGTGASYDVRYSTSTITELNWGTALQAVGEPAPQIAGTAESMTLAGLTADTVYYVAIKTSDEVPNISTLSNVVTTTTLPTPDTTAPSAIVNLAVTGRTGTAVSLSWTSPGDDNNTGTATSYDLRYSTTTITEGNWSSRTQFVGEPIPLISGSTQSSTVSGLNSDTLYYFAIKTSDEAPNTSALSNIVSTSTLDVTAPSAIVNLAISSTTQTTATLTWTAPGDDASSGTATSYDLRYSTTTITEGNWASANQVTGEPVPAVAGSSESKVVTSLLASTSYYFAIKTSDEVPNISTLSNVVTTTTLPTPDTTAPAAVANLAATARTSSTVSLAWTSPGDDNNTGTATSYDIRYSTTTITEGNWSSRTQVTGEPTPLIAGLTQNYLVAGLVSDTVYYFAIKTSDEVPNISALSNVVVTSTLDVTAPSAVANLAISSTTQTTATLTWTSPGDDNGAGTAATYDIRYSTTTITEGNWSTRTQVAGEPAPLVAGSSQNMSVGSLTPNTSYFFAIKTSDEVPNISTLSNVVTTTTLPTPDTTAPSAIVNLAVTGRTGTAVSLSWTSPGDDNNTGTATSYDLRYSTTTITEGNWSSRTQFVGEPIPQVAGTSQSSTIIGLSNQTTYYFAIKTSDEVPNISALSNVVSTSTLDIIAPSAIVNLAVSTSTTSTATLTWTSPGDDANVGTATSYDIRYSTTTITEGNWSTLTQVAGEPAALVAGFSQNYQVTGLSPNTTYYFAIKTSDEVPNISSLSNVTSVLTQSISQSTYLTLDTSGVGLAFSNRVVIGLVLGNSSTSTSITVAQMIVSWSGVPASRRLQRIDISGGTVWTGNNSSGQTANITDNVLTVGDTDPINRLRFNNSMSGSTISITFIMLDGSTRTFSGITP